MAFDFAFLDSGTGGIPYMLYLKEKMPGARCVYLGDTAHFPYGEKSPAQVTECACQASRLIIEKWKPKTLVVACNTISVTSLLDLRKAFPSVPIVGTVPAIKLAAKVTHNKRIGLLATNATVSHPYCQNLIHDFASGCTVFSRADPDLISFIEHNLFVSSKADRLSAVRPAVDFFLQNGCDTIILGCTHFTHIAKDIQDAAGKGVFVVDSREGVANQALRVESQAEGILQGPVEEEALDGTFFVTAASLEQEREYKKMCGRFKIPFGGVLPLFSGS